MNSAMPHLPWWLEQTCNRTNVANRNFKGSSVLYLFVESLIMFIFGVLVT